MTGLETEKPLKCNNLRFRDLLRAETVGPGQGGGGSRRRFVLSFRVRGRLIRVRTPENGGATGRGSRRLEDSRASSRPFSGVDRLAGWRYFTTRFRQPAEAAVVVVAQSVRAPDCGSGGCGFKSRQPPSWRGKAAAEVRSSIGRAPVSKTGGCRFDSCRACETGCDAAGVALSSRGPGHSPLKAGTRVRIPLALSAGPGPIV